MNDEDIHSKISNFETILKTYSVSKSLLYSDKLKSKTSQSLKSEDVIKNVSKQIKAINNNETHRKTDSNRIIAYKESELTSINSIKLPLELQQKHLVARTFDYDSEYDSQLILTTKDVEATTDLGAGVTQEFETPFGSSSQSKLDSNVDANRISSGVLKIDVPLQSHLIQDTIPNKYCDLHLVNIENQADSIDECNMQMLSKRATCGHNTSFLLESFEKFEAMAVPIVRENYCNVEAMKKIMILKMLHDTEPQVTPEQRQFEDVENDSESIPLSPILKLKTDKKELKKHEHCDFINNNEFLEEEILFSSDEESDNDHNQAEELPLTCALQTSFYEQEHVLDKTIYVGFQTASNKSIQVLTDSFKTAKTILNDCYDTKKPIVNSLSLSELVDVYSSTLNERKDSQLPKESESYLEECKTGKSAYNTMVCCQEKQKKLCEMKHYDEREHYKKHMTVSNTQEEMKIDDYVMQEFEENLCIDDNKLHTNLSMSNQPLLNTNLNCRELNNHLEKNKNEKDREQKHIKNFNINDKILCPNEYLTGKTKNINNSTKEIFTGFKTASNKHIDISQEALVKSKKILDEIHFQGDPTATPDDGSIKTLNKNENINNFSGFTTPSNKSINISKEAYYAQSKTTYHDFGIPFVPMAKNGDSDILINNDNEIDQKKEAQCQDMQDNNKCDLKHFVKSDFNESSSVKKALQGFKTASNNPVKISDEALKKSRRIFQDICDGNDYGNNLPDHKEIKKSAFNNCDLVPFKAHDKEPSFLNILGITFQGFKTASNKPVQLSEEALEKSRKIFQGIGDGNDYENHLPEKQVIKKSAFSNIGFHTTSYNDCDLVPFKAQDKELCSLNTLGKSFQGFKTASNKPVQLSEEALEKSRKIFQDIGDGNDYENHFPEKQGIKQSAFSNIGFQTTSYNDCDLVALKPKNKEPSSSNTVGITFQGFKTASNNPVKISEGALEKSKKIFEDIGDGNDYDSKLHEKQVITYSACDNNSLRNADYNKFHSIPFKPPNKEPSSINTLVKSFQGFKTASNKPVKLSKEALERSKKIFEGIDDNHLPENHVIENSAFSNINFETAYHKRVVVSEEALKKTKIIFQDVDSNLKTMIKQKINYTMQNAPMEMRSNVLEDKSNMLGSRKKYYNEDKTVLENVDVSNIINTEVIRNFNDTLLTEDFINKSPSNKRSGSPILSCPKAKKIKKRPETKNIFSSDEPKFEASCVPIDKINKFTFSSSYKKYKKYKLIDMYKMDKVPNTIVQSCKEVNYNIDNISNFEFVGLRNEISNSKWTSVDVTQYFLELVNKNIIPKGWIENHIKLITFKLLSYEKRFPNTMKNVCSVCNILEQLKYRYDRELYNVERPAIRKILEKDEVSSRRMVLQVLNIFKDGVSVTYPFDAAEDVELLVSDGWYCVKATVDKLLTKLACEGKITTGTKLITHGAELMNCDQGVAPWEDTSLVRLKIFGNSTRRAHWAAKLGFHGNGAILSYLTAVKPEGGKISQLRVIVTRVYPMLYVEKFDDGSTVTRSERLENLHQMKYEMERETILEKIYEEVEKEFCMQVSQCDSVEDDKKSLESGSQIYQMMKKSRDPAEFRASLTYSQAKILQDYIDKRREVSRQDLQSKVQNELKKRGVSFTRNVVAMLKIRVADVYKQNVTKAMITVWRPHESLVHLLREGMWLDIHNVVPTAVRYSEIQISAGKQSLFRKTSKVDDKMSNIARTFQRKCYLIRELTQNPLITTDYNEVDLVGLVFDIEPPLREFDCKKQLFQNVFLADANKNIICINFWGGLKKFGFENILETEQVVACVNLQKRSGNTRKNIPQYRATEFTYFTKTPKIDACRQVCEDLSKQFLSLDRRKFVQDCIVLRSNLVNMRYGNIENISPYRFNNSDYNLSKNKIFINSPSVDPNLNINGLDFDSTFRQTDTEISPKALLRKKDISDRIAKLQRYGEPPPLSSIHILNKSKNAVKPYRSPLISKTELNKQTSNELTSVKPQSEDSSALDNPGDVKPNNTCTSPVLPYKRRRVNPVKLNFSKPNDVPKVYPFGEDFETSPPLSLD